MLDTIKSVLAERRGNRRKLFNVVFSTDEGERVFRHICKLAHVGHSTYVKGDHDRTMMNEGARNLALLLIQIRNVDPDKMAAQLQTPQNDDI